MLWLIILGCVVKVVAQIEFGRYAIISGKTTLRALDEVPGPRFRGRGNWLVWYWLAMWLCSISQLGGIIGVGAAELVVYPYWCLEKGDARFAGKNDGSEQ